MQFEMLQKLHSGAELTTEDLAEIYPDALPYLAYAGRLDVLRRMHDELPDGEHMAGLKLADTALMEACGAGHLDIAKYFVDEIGDSRRFFWTPHEHSAFSAGEKYGALEAAAAGGHLPVVEYLLERYQKVPSHNTGQFLDFLYHGALVDSKALMGAIENNHPEVAQCIIEHAKEVERFLAAPRGLGEAIVRNDMHTLIDALSEDMEHHELREIEEEALKQDKPELFMGFLDQKRHHQHIVNGAYFAAEAFGSAQILSRLIDIFVPEIDAEIIAGLDNEKGTYPAFHVACQRGNVELLDKVLSIVPEADYASMFVSKRNERHPSGLTEAVRGEHVGFVPVLLEKAGEQASAMVAQDNFLALRVAVKQGLIDTTKQLLAAASDKEAAMQHVPEKWQKVLDDEPKRHLLWQEIGKGPQRWQAVTRADAPEGVDSARMSPFAFSPKLYEAVLPLMKAAEKVEGNTGAEARAYKLAVLFSNEAEAFKYLKTYADAHPEDGQPIHDACEFELPINGAWDVNAWKGKALRFGYDFTQYLEHAGKIQNLVDQEGVAVPQSPRELAALHSQFVYERANERPDLAKVAALCKPPVSEERFDMALDFLNAHGKTKDNLPPIMIDGAELLKADASLPKNISGYYMVKLEASDPRGLFLGDLTNCCQSIGKAGSDYAKHGASSEHGGFYVWMKKTGGQVTPEDTMVAQSWAWESKNNAVTFDSFERLSADYNYLAKPFLDRFEEIATEKYGYKKVTIGKGGETPDLPYPEAKPPERPKDFKYRHSMEAEFDSKRQYWVTRTEQSSEEPKRSK